MFLLPTVFIKRFSVFYFFNKKRVFNVFILVVNVFYIYDFKYNCPVLCRSDIFALIGGLKAS